MVLNRLFLILCIYCLIVSGSFGQKCKSCKNIDLVEAVNCGILSEDLAIADINQIFLACPKFHSGDTSLCEASLIKISDDWDPKLPNDLIWTLFFQKNHYELIKDIVYDDFFIESLKEISDPSDEAISWFKLNWNSYTSLLPLNDDIIDYHDISQLDFVQLKMITIFYSIKSWTFCPEKRIIDGSFTVHGMYDKSQNIVLYETACRAKQVYKSDLKNLAISLKFHFVGAHELSHAIDFQNGSLQDNTDENRSKAEKRANINGLIITKGISRLFNKYFEYSKIRVHEYSNDAKKCDLDFISSIINNWKDVETLFEKEIIKAKKRIDLNISAEKLNKSEWSEWGCLEKI